MEESSINREIDKPNLDDAFKRYEQAITNLKESTHDVTVEQILTVLTARDALDLALSDKTQNLAKYLIKINELDKTLRKNSNLISTCENLVDLRNLVNPSEEAWWWTSEVTPKNFWNRFDWLWGTLTVPWLAVNLGLIADISSRFLTGTPDTISTFTIVFQSMLAALATGGALTKTGQDLVDGIFDNLKIPKRFWQEAKLTSAIILSISLIAFRASLPSISLFYNERGFESFSSGRLDSAKQDFIQAIRLNPNFMEAHYNLGQIYERLQDSENALTQYKIAAELGSVRAYSVIGRIYNLKKEYSLAVYFLLRGEHLLQTKLTGSNVYKDIDTRYAIFRNLSWARLEQGRYSEAQAYLENSIRLIPKRATGHCLMARVLNKLKQSEQAKDSWRKCLDYSSTLTSDEMSIELDEWIGLAKKELNSNEVK